LDGLHFLTENRSYIVEGDIYWTIGEKILQKSGPVVVQFYTLDSTHNLIQFVHLLTPTGCECVRKHRMEEIGTSHGRDVDPYRAESDIVLTLTTFTGSLADHENVIDDHTSVIIGRYIDRGPIEEEENNEEIQEDDDP
jgi:hypothetical protein